MPSSILTFATVLLAARQAFSCSTIAVSKQASLTGSVFTTHSDDGEGNPDPRIVVVPGRQVKVGDLRPIYPDLEDFPRHIGADRSPGYAPGAYPHGSKQNLTKPIGHIPYEVSTLYTYYDTNYGVMNEKGLHIGESTCSGVFGTSAIGSGGKALLSINELSRIAMSRCEKARDAVQVMGDLAVKYGFYGAGSFEGTAESLLVGDSDEVWVFHILPDSEAGGSAIWTAQRVPDGHATGVFNMFTIREVNLTDSANFLGSSNMHEIALKHNLWDGKGLLDFTKTFSDGEYAHKYYSGRRFWRAMSLLAPSLNLSATYGNLKNDNPYPWSVKPDKPVTREMLFKIHRDYYGDTPYDTSKGLAAGPYGAIDRLKVAANGMAINGSWERTITLFRTTYSFVNEARNGDLGVSWFGPHAAHGTVYVPIIPASKSIPDCLAIGSPKFVDREASWWAHRFLENQARLNYNGYHKEIAKAQEYFERNGATMVKSFSSKSNPQDIARAQDMHARAARDAFWKLSDDLMVKFADGFLDQGEPYGYPKWYLEAVGFQNGPAPIRPKLN